MVAQILGSKIYKLEEFEVLGRHRDLYTFLNNRVYFTVDHHAKQYDLWDNVVQWIEQNVEGKVIIEKAPNENDISSVLRNVSFFIYFEKDTDLSMFAVRWQGKDE